MQRGTGVRRSSAKRSLLSFRKRAAPRNLLTLNLSALVKVSDTDDRVYLRVSKMETERKRLSTSRFLGAARFRNDKRKRFARPNAPPHRMILFKTNCFSTSLSRQ